ncbi:MAG TPA: 2-oxoglutarate oxidoreductase [Firmicutes bacterium]|nr:2-oxoglutarate oxidoreductase [Candidatus Fermentithermobacillaceae bacterium]
MKAIYERPRALKDVVTHYCPGCTHGIAHRILAEVIDELGIQGNTVGVASVGCSVFAYNYIDVDFQQAAHGRAPAVATGIKRVLPETIVFTYQGDGDLASIGAAEILHAAARGENITVIFINNAIYGMTGGQMAPTTLEGMRTTTTPLGRQPASQGYPLRVSELLSTVEGAAYIARCSLHNAANIAKAKASLKKAFETQIQKKGFSFVELLSSCPTNWGLSPQEALKWIEEKMIPVFPLGEFKVKEGEVR